MPVVMFYGDSRALAWAAPNTDKYTFINRSIGNQTSEQVVLRFQKHVEQVKPDIIIIQVCINDLKVIPLFPNDEKSIITNCKANLQKLVYLSISNDINVILSTVYPLGYVTPAHNILGIRERPIIEGIVEINNYIHSLASEHVVVFDSYKLLKGQDNKISSEFSKDWLHLSPKGYEQLNSYIFEAIERAK